MELSRSTTGCPADSVTAVRSASVRPESEHLAEPGGGAGVHEEGAFIGAEVFPVSAAECGQAVHCDKALVALPPENTPLVT